MPSLELTFAFGVLSLLLCSLCLFRQLLVAVLVCHRSFRSHLWLALCCAALCLGCRCFAAWLSAMGRSTSTLRSLLLPLSQQGQDMRTNTQQSGLLLYGRPLQPNAYKRTSTLRTSAWWPPLSQPVQSKQTAHALCQGFSWLWAVRGKVAVYPCNAQPCSCVCVAVSCHFGCNPNANALPPALPNVSPTFIRGSPREVQVTGPAPLHRDLGLSWAWLGTLSPDHQGVD